MLIVDRVLFENFNLFERLELKFERGLIGLSGPNGSGKTTVLDGIYGGITGDFSRFSGVKADCVRLGSAGKPAFVEVDVDAGGSKLRIRRQVREGAKPANSLTVDGGKPITNSDKIREEFDRAIGATGQQLDEFSFKRARETTAVVRLPVADRFRLFQAVAGLQRYEKIHEALGKIASARHVYQTADDVAGMEARLAEDSALLDERAKAIDAAEATSQGASRGLPAARETLRISEARRSIRAELPGLQSALEALPDDSALQSAADESRKAFAEFEKKHRKSVAGWEKTRGRAAEVATYDAAVQRRAQAESLVRANEGGLASAVKPAYPDQRARAEKLKSDLAVAQARLDDLDARIKKLSAIGSDTCPLCGSECNAATSLARLRPERAEALKSRDEVKTYFAEANELSLAWARWERAQSDWTVRLSEAKAALASLPPAVDPGVTLQDTKDAAGKIFQSNNELERLRKIVEIKEKAVQAARKSRAEAEAAWKSANDRLDVLPPVTKAERLAAEATVEAAREAELLLIGLRAEEAQLSKSVERETKDLAAARERVAKAARENRIGDIVKSARDLFHHRAVPASLARKGLGKVQSLVNARLAEFDSPFVVELDESFEFFARKPGGGGSHAASRLSDGQAAVLSLAFWLSVSRVWGSDVNFLALDEPTANLDEANRTFLGQSLVKVAERIKGKSQIMLVSHADNLRHVFTQNIDLSSRR